jgi:two-component system CheB/CheR fusion protein
MPTPPAATDPGLEALLHHLKEVRAFDFTGYKRATLTRRIDKRMAEVGVEGYGDYVDYLQVHPDEFASLFNTICINVTAFFRDSAAWDELRSTVLPELLDRLDTGPIRAWSAGCASGQEAYSLVMAVAEVLGPEATRERLKVYATDIDEEALAQGRAARYTARELESLPEGFREKYFEELPTGWVFSADLRRCVIFGRHDLLQDAPISKVDLLLCRNTLMYFNADVQALLMNRLHFALAPGGVLFLGKVEMLLNRSELFDAVNAKQRIFRKVTRSSLRSRLLAMTAHVAPVPFVGSDDERLVDLAFESVDEAVVLLDAEGNLSLANQYARTLFAIPVESLGRPFQDLELSYRPLELRSWIDQAIQDRLPATVRDVERWGPGGQRTYLDVTVSPLIADQELVGILIWFADVTRHRRLHEELEVVHRELETAHEELQSTNEELETTNEELQSTVEELETTNEELQSTNEELETMNEELSSTNEELHTINDELRERTSELDEVSAFMESILTSIELAVVVVDTEMCVRIWNGISYELWGLRSEEVEGHNLLSIEFGLPVEQLAPALHACLAGAAPEAAVTLPARNRVGQAITCHVRVRSLTGKGGKVDGAIVLIEPSASPQAG